MRRKSATSPWRPVEEEKEKIQHARFGFLCEINDFFCVSVKACPLSAQGTMPFIQMLSDLDAKGGACLGRTSLFSLFYLFYLCVSKVPKKEKLPTMLVYL